MTRLLALALLASTASAQQLATTPLFWPDKNGPTLDNRVPDNEAILIPKVWDEASGKTAATLDAYYYA